MSAAQAADGQTPDQENKISEGENIVDEEVNDAPSGNEPPEYYRKLEAQVGLLADSIGELRESVLSSRPSQQAAVEEEFDDDEPLTARKASTLVSRAVSRAVSQRSLAEEKREWDNRVKSEFPVSDPEFQRELKREWREFAENGGDPTAPRSLYYVAKHVAKGWKKPGATKSATKSTQLDDDTQTTSEVPTSGASRQSRRGKVSVSDNDPRLRFYQMKGNISAEKLERLKQKLAEQDARREKR